MKLRETLTLPLPAAAAAAMYADPEYTEIRRTTLGASRAESTLDGDPSAAFTVRTELSMPTDACRTWCGPSSLLRDDP